MRRKRFISELGIDKLVCATYLEEIEQGEEGIKGVAEPGFLWGNELEGVLFFLYHCHPLGAQHKEDKEEGLQGEERGI